MVLKKSAKLEIEYNAKDQDGNTAFAAQSYEGIQVYDIRNFSNPVLKG